MLILLSGLPFYILFNCYFILNSCGKIANMTRLLFLITVIICLLQVSAQLIAQPKVAPWSNTKLYMVDETWFDAKLPFKGFVHFGKEEGLTTKGMMSFLLQDKDGLYYIPVVKNQNDGLPVKFAATTITKEKIVFENAQHDFPQVISYTKINKDSLVAEIAGTKNGKERKQVFPMKRVK